MRQKRRERGEEVKTKWIVGDSDYGEDVSDDSEELVYDSEEEAERDQEAFMEKFEANKIIKVKIKDHKIDQLYRIKLIISSNS